MSVAMKEAYRDGQSKFSQGMIELLFPSHPVQSIEERSRDAVKRIFEAVDEARAESEVDSE